MRGGEASKIRIWVVSRLTTPLLLLNTCNERVPGGLSHRVGRGEGGTCKEGGSIAPTCSPKDYHIYISASIPSPNSVKSSSLCNNHLIQKF